MLLKLGLCLASLFYIISSKAAPWVELDDLSLRSNIQLLADAGIITAPVTTYPLMWNAIKSDILSADEYQLTGSQLQALNHVRYSFRYAKQHSEITKKSIYLSNRAQRFTSYGNSDFDQGNIALSHEFLTENLAGKIQANYRLGLNDIPNLQQGSDFNLDGSYLAYKWGNWILSAGAIERWWGPGIDTSLIMSTNARPLPTLNLSRDSSAAFETPWLNWIGPWTVTAQMAQLESTRYVPDTMMWSSRATFRPLRGLEIGASWSFQWAGTGQPSSFSDFFEILFGGLECANDEPNCDEEMNSHIGNHLAGYDVRWSDTLFDLPYAVYLQTIGEDGAQSSIITDKADMYGAEVRFKAFKQQIMLNLEYTNTQTACGGTGSTALNCFYEHGTYRSGYRYNRRTIGSTYDNDAQSLVATVLIQTLAGNSWQLTLKKLQLNTDNIDRFPNDINLGNPVSKIAEDALQFDGQYKFIAFDSRFTTGIVLTRSSFPNESQLDSETNIDAYIKWEYRF